jgi:hypothetical protein
MKIYEIKHQAVDCAPFAWASGYGPLETVTFLSPIFLERRRKYWEVNPSPPGLKIDAGASKWPDFLGCGHPAPSYFVSDRVVHALQAINVDLLHLAEMPIATIGSKKLRVIPAPNYYILQAKPGIEWNFKASGLDVDSDGKPVMDASSKNWPPVINLKVKTWNGMDVFTFANWQVGLSTTLFCTERIVEIAKKEEWTNVRFDPVPTS